MNLIICPIGIIIFLFFLERKDFRLKVFTDCENTIKMYATKNFE